MSLCISNGYWVTVLSNDVGPSSEFVPQFKRYFDANKFRFFFASVRVTRNRGKRASREIAVHEMNFWAEGGGNVPKMNKMWNDENRWELQANIECTEDEEIKTANMTHRIARAWMSGTEMFTFYSIIIIIGNQSFRFYIVTVSPTAALRCHWWILNTRIQIQLSTHTYIWIGNRRGNHLHMKHDGNDDDGDWRQHTNDGNLNINLLKIDWIHFVLGKLHAMRSKYIRQSRCRDEFAR